MLRGSRSPCEKTISTSRGNAESSSSVNFGVQKSVRIFRYSSMNSAVVSRRGRGWPARESRCYSMGVRAVEDRNCAKICLSCIAMWSSSDVVMESIDLSSEVPRASVIHMYQTGSEEGTCRTRGTGIDVLERTNSRTRASSEKWDPPYLMATPGAVRETLQAPLSDL